MTRILLTMLALPAVALADEPKADKKAPKPLPIAELKRAEAVSFEKEILPILAAKCQACHAGKITEGKLDLSTYAAMMKGGATTGGVIAAGKSGESSLFLRSAHIRGPIMPPKNEGDPLSPQELALLKLWIDQGAKPPAVDAKITRTVTLSLPPAMVKPVRAVAINADKTVVAAGRGNQVHLFDAKTGEFKATLVDPELKTPDGKPAAAAHISLVEAMAYSPDGKTLATGSFRELTLWDVTAGKPKARIGGFADRVVTIAFSPDGKLIATGGGAPTEDGEVKLFDAAGKLVTEFKNAHSDQVFGVSFSPDGKLLATGGADKFVKVFEVPAGKLVKSFEGHTNHVLDVGWTADGKKLVSCGADSDKMVKVWDYEKGEKLRDMTTHKNQTTRLVFVPKTATFITCGGDGGSNLWNADNGGNQKNFPGAKDFLYAVAVSGDGKVVAHGGEEGVVRLYNGDNGQLIKELLPAGESPKKIDPPTPPKK
ncbi:MAG: NB-ARC domain protein [Fimbriiglobus sp.]|nr:NB-ARC domain protein [Fimbriiglobus sp.]